MKNIKQTVAFLSLLNLSLLSMQAQIELKTPQQKWTIEKCVNQLSMDKVTPTNVGYQYWFADENFLDGRTIKLNVIIPGKATHESLKYAQDEFFFVLDGTAKFYLNGDSIVSGQYTSFYCPSMVEHGIANAGETELKYLVIKTYQKK